MSSYHYIKSAVLLLALTLTTHLSAQKLRPSHGEIGLNFGNFNVTSIQFSGFWKKQLAPDKYRRLRFFSGSLFIRLDEIPINGNLSVGLAIGREKRINLDEKLQFYRGFEVMGSVSISVLNSQGLYPWLFSPSVGMVLGFQHKLNNLWAINVETIPTLGAKISSNYGQPRDQFRVFANASNSAAIGLVRIF
jgi:hypothetical protein